VKKLILILATFPLLALGQFGSFTVDKPFLAASAANVASPIPSDAYFWLRNESLSGYANGTRPDVWADSSGNGRSGYFKSDAGALFYVTNNVVTNLPAMRCLTDGSTKPGWITITNAQAFLRAKTNATVFMVFRKMASGNAFASPFHCFSPDSDYWMGMQSASGGVNYSGYTTRLTADASTATGTAGALGSYWVYLRANMDWQNTTYLIKTNGITMINDTSQGSAGTTQDADGAGGSANAVHFGGSSASTSFNYEAAEIVGYNRALTASEVIQIETYLAAKFGLPSPP
jgi:hypothetical protein